MSIDWIAVAVLGAAWAFSRVTSVSLALRNWVFALACFGIAGYRFSMGGGNPLFALIAAAIGVSYALQALKARKT